MSNSHLKKMTDELGGQRARVAQLGSRTPQPHWGGLTKAGSTQGQDLYQDRCTLEPPQSQSYSHKGLAGPIPKPLATWGMSGLARASAQL